jgi:hypothetical protein
VIILDKKKPLKGKDTVYVQILGIAQIAGQFKVDGDKVVISTPNWMGIMFTRKGRHARVDVDGPHDGVQEAVIGDNGHAVARAARFNLGHDSEGTGRLKARRA